MRMDTARVMLKQLEALRAEAYAKVSDAELLTAFHTRQDSPAFEELVRRHGGMVWAVCRQMLPPTDAEDAFQVVFLALLRSSERKTIQHVGSWLHGTAVRCSLKLRRSAARARKREVDQAKPEAEVALGEGQWDAMLSALHEEVERLPTNLRTAFVLCDLEGVSQPDAAERLGWKPGTLTGRLSQARQRLLRSLSQRGYASATGVALFGLGSATASVEAPLKLVTQLTQIATTGAAAIPVAFLTLIPEIIPMTLSKLKLVALSVITTVALSTSTTYWAIQAQEKPTSTPAPASATTLPPPVEKPKATPTPPALSNPKGDPSEKTILSGGIQAVRSGNSIGEFKLTSRRPEMTMEMFLELHASEFRDGFSFQGEIELRTQSGVGSYYVFFKPYPQPSTQPQPAKRLPDPLIPERPAPTPMPTPMPSQFSPTLPPPTALPAPRVPSSPSPKPDSNESMPTVIALKNIPAEDAMNIARSVFADSETFRGHAITKTNTLVLFGMNSTQKDQLMKLIQQLDTPFEERIPSPTLQRAYDERIPSQFLPAIPVLPSPMPSEEPVKPTPKKKAPATKKNPPVPDVAR
jgi:RNA polymerase sigma factor (sigma-70 family)